MQELISEVAREFAKREEVEIMKAFEKVFGEPFGGDTFDMTALKRCIYLGKEYYCYKNECFLIVEQDVKMEENDGNYTLKRKAYIPNAPLHIYEIDGKIRIK